MNDKSSLQKQDTDPAESSEWLESLQAVIERKVFVSKVFAVMLVAAVAVTPWLTILINDMQADLFAQELAGQAVRQAIFLQEVAHPQVRFSLAGDEGKAEHILCDRHQIGQALTNVLKKRGAESRPLFKACSEHNE